MADRKDFWHDVRVHVTKELIVKAVTYTLGLPIVLTIAAAVWQPVRDWLTGDSHMYRWAVVLLAWLLLIALAAFARLAYRKRTAQSGAAASKEQPRAPVKFAPENLRLTPPLCRALLKLRTRIDQRTSLHDLHELVTDYGSHVDQETTKAQLQHDMDAAERAGVVSIDRLGTLTQYYNLAIPDGRDWVLQHASELEAEVSKGLTPKIPRRHF